MAKTTRKAILEEYEVVAVHIEDVPHLLKEESPFAYTEGVHGVNEIFEGHGKIVICAGTCPFGAYSVSRERARFYDEEARKILERKRKALAHKNERRARQLWQYCTEDFGYLWKKFIAEALLGYELEVTIDPRV